MTGDHLTNWWGNSWEAWDSNQSHNLIFIMQSSELTRYCWDWVNINLMRNMNSEKKVNTLSFRKEDPIIASII